VGVVFGRIRGRMLVLVLFYGRHCVYQGETESGECLDGGEDGDDEVVERGEDGR